MGQVLVQVVLALTAVSALSIPNKPSAEPMTLPMNFGRSEPSTGGCLLKRSEHTEHEHKKRGIQGSCRQFQQQVDEAFEKCSERAGNALKALNGRDFPAKDESAKGKPGKGKPGEGTSGKGTSGEDTSDNEIPDTRKRAGKENSQPKEDGKETLPKLLQDWFSTGTNDQQAIEKMRKDFTNIKAECDKKDASRVAVKCEQCGQGIAGQTYQGTGPITLCLVALDNDRNSTNIQAQDLGDVLLHEMSHVVGYTEDLGYGVQKCKQLDTKSSLDNADSFTKFALATTVGDKTGPSGEGGPSTGPQGPGSKGRPRPGPQGGLPSGFQGGPPPSSQGEQFKPGKGRPGDFNPGTSGGPFTGTEGVEMGEGEISSGQLPPEILTPPPEVLTPPPQTFSPPESFSPSGAASSSGGFPSNQGFSASRGSSRVASPPENLGPVQNFALSEDSPPSSKGNPPTAMVLPFTGSEKA